MKKIFLFIATATLALSINSCSSDDNSDSNSGGTPGGTITAKINGVSKTFNNVIVNERRYEEDGGYTLLNVTATIGTSATDVVTFTCEKGTVGTDAIWDFHYTQGTTGYYSNPMTIVTQTNNDTKKLKGSFNGTWTPFNSGTDLTVTEGSFDIQY